MKVKYLGHSSFLITSNNTKIVTDPYKPGGPLAYNEINESADIVTVSHEHGDHNNAAVIKGNPEVVRGGAKTTKAKNIEFRGVAAFHNAARSTENTILCFRLEGLNLCHLGDLGHTLDSKEMIAIGKVDILFVPIGGKYTVDAANAAEVVKALNPKLAFPMHYENDKCKIGIDTVDKFTKLMSDVQVLDATETEIRADGLPAKTRVIVLKPAC